MSRKKPRTQEKHLEEATENPDCLCGKKMTRILGGRVITFEKGYLCYGCGRKIETTHPKIKKALELIKEFERE